MSSRIDAHGVLRGRVAARLAIAAAALLPFAASAPGAEAAMVSKRIGPKLCVTTGGGKIVPLPGFPGESIDRRLLRDVRYLRRHYDIHITDGYSTDPVHSAAGEHPLGLALDITPPPGLGWATISSLARWAEPRQDRPRQPFRWVGYDGDANHGRGHHLHLSWDHSPASFGKVAKTVYTIKCPSRTSTPQPDEEPSDGDGGIGGAPPGTDGGTTPGSGKEPSPSGGIGLRAAASSIETGGVDRNR